MYHFPSQRAPQSGFTLVEVVLASALIAMVFGALMAGAQAMLQVVSSSKAASGALGITSEQMEYTRSFSYNDLGTQAGVPAGLIPQLRSTILNDVTYNVRTLVQYIDDPADGSGSADTNSILADYKQIKVVTSWEDRGETKSVTLVSNVVPPGIETAGGGGTIRVNVFDANVQPVAGAAVRFINTTVSPAIDTVRLTDLSGIAYLSAAPASAGYEILVTRNGYSNDGTANPSTSNPNPTTPPVAVLVGQVSTMNFQIDELSTFTLETVAVPVRGEFLDTFENSTAIGTTSNTIVINGAVELTGGPTTYDTFGMVQSIITTPATITNWYTAMFTASTTADASVRVMVTYDSGSGAALVPNSDLPGNSAGFASSPIDLTELAVSTYPNLGLQAVFESTSTSASASLKQWSLLYTESQAPIASAGITLTGNKSIGTDGASQSVIKNVYTGTTNSSGEWTNTNVEFDFYQIQVMRSGYSVYELCPVSPLSVAPGDTLSVQAVLAPASSNMLRVHVREASGLPIRGASVRLENTGIDVSGTTSLCGQIYFGAGLYASDDYLLTVSAAGYNPEIIASTTVSATAAVNVILD